MQGRRISCGGHTAIRCNAVRSIPQAVISEVRYRTGLRSRSVGIRLVGNDRQAVHIATYCRDVAEGCYRFSDETEAIGSVFPNIAALVRDGRLSVDGCFESIACGSGGQTDGFDGN